MRFRSLFVACVLPLAVTGAVYGCSGDPAPEDLCGWLQNPNGTNCVAEFHEDIKEKCGALDAPSVAGTFAKREALDMCVLAKGGSVVFDPPIDLTKLPPVMTTTMKITNGDGSACGEIAYTSTFAWSLKIAAPASGTGGGGGAGGGTTAGAGGSEEQSEPHYSKGTISVTSLGGDTIQVACPAPDAAPSGALATPESHVFNLNQSLQATPSNGCPQYAQIIPQAILDVDPGGVQRAGSVRLKLQFPPEAPPATTAGAGSSGGATSSTGSNGAAVTIAPELVFYFDCAIPAAPLICANGIMDASESDIDCGGPESTPGCPVRCGEAQQCASDCDCDNVSTCVVDKMGVKRCTAGDAGTTVKGACPGIICSNHVKDASESDVDCGGSCPTKCNDGQSCGVNADCTGNSCTLGICSPAKCTDKTTNGAETDVDCGGPFCPKCADGKTCMAATDCTINGCLNGKCSPCADGVQDGNESDIDCGGGTCPKCDNGKVCTGPGDCTSAQCDGSRCGSCSDGMKDGDESDVDCGGSCPTKCPESKICFKNGDCALNVCQPDPQADGGVPTGVCNTCNDAITDGTESDKDCGGATCKKCVVGNICKVNLDCASGICISKICK